MRGEGGRVVEASPGHKLSSIILININTLTFLSFFVFFFLFETFIFKWSQNQYDGAKTPGVTYFVLYFLVIKGCSAPMHQPSTKTHPSNMLIAVHLVNIICG